jgi:hypothetical protein
MTFSELGRTAKTEYPDYADISDYEAGKAYALTYLKEDLHKIEDDQLLPSIGLETSLQLPPSSSLVVQTDAHFFLHWRASHIGNQIAFIDTQYSKDDAIRYAPERWQQKHYLERAQYVVSVLNLRSQAQDLVVKQQLASEALKYGFDTVSYLVFRLRQIDTDEQIRLRAETLRQDQEHKEQIARIEREHEEAQAFSYIRTSTEASLADRQRQKKLYDDLAQRREREYQIEVGDKPLKLKNQLLQDVRREMASIREQLDGIEETYRKTDSRQTHGRSSDESTDS